MTVTVFDPEAPADVEVSRVAARAVANNEAPLVLVSTADGVQVAVAVYRWVTETEASHAGWWLTYVAVAADYQGQGHGHDLVAEVCRRHLADHPGEPLYLARPPAADRAFRGGFGFRPLARAQYRRQRGLRVYIANPPDPDWTRG